MSGAIAGTLGPAVAAPARGGSAGRLFEVFRQEFAHNLRRPLFWVLIAILGLFALMLSNGNAQIGSGDARVGGTKAWINSEYAISQLLIMLVGTLYAFFACVAAGMTFIREDEQKVVELLHSTRLSPGEYVWGKFLAQLASFAGVLGAHLALSILFNEIVPHGQNADSFGPFVLANYLKPALFFGLPLLVLIAGTSLAIGGFTRKPILVFALPVAVVLFGAFFLWEWSPSWLAPGWNRLLMFVDLTGFRWMNETWLNVDKGVDYYNRRPVGLDLLIVAQRALCIALGLGAVAWYQRGFAAQLRGAAARRSARKARTRSEAVASASAAGEAAPLETLGMTSRAPGLVAGALAVARVEWRELWKHPGLYLFVPMILLQTFGNVVQTGAFDTEVMLTPGILAVRQMNTLTLLVCLLILFYTAESLQRERSAGLGPIAYATPLRTASLLLGKAFANTVLGLAILGACLIGCAIMVLAQGKVPFSLVPFALVWGLLMTPTFLLWTAFVCAAFALTGNRIGAYVVGFTAVGLTGWFQARGRMNWTFNWDLWGAVRWSDISVFELDRLPLLLNRVLALGLAAFFVVLTVRAFSRRESDATRTLHRLRPAALGGQALALAPWLVVPLACGIWLQTLVHHGREGAWAQKQERDYWAKNIQTWKDAPVPILARAEFDLEVEPSRGRVISKGTYVAVNRTPDTLRQVPVTGGYHWKRLKWTMDRKPYQPERRANLYVFTPAAPLAPGDEIAIGFEFDGVYPPGASKNGRGAMEFVLPSAVVLTGFGSTAFAPQLGYDPAIGVERDKNRADPREYPDDYWRRTLTAELPMFDGWCDTRFRLTGPEALQHNVTGVRVSERIEHGKRTTEWRSDAPVRAFNVVMGRWEVKRRDGVAVHYDARHPFNVDEMLDALAGARKWYGEWFAPYPYRELRVSEFPALATYAMGPPTNITFSEGIGYLTRSKPKANTAFWVTAHEAAHQWWPCIVMPGAGPGAEVLSEGMAHFSTILLCEQVRGLEQRIGFCKQIEDRYANTRVRDSERPLTRVDGSLPGEGQIIYDRGGFVFWMLHRLMGREANLAAHREYVATYRDSRDHPLIEEYLAILRRHAPDPAAFDGFARQWIFGTVVPQYLITESTRVRAGGGWDVRARVKNVGTGVVPIEIAATRGERFPERRTKENAYQDARVTVTLGAGEERAITIRCAFEPAKLLVDPDVTVLMLERQKAEVRLPEAREPVELASR